MYYIQTLYFNSIKWTLLELKIPKNILKTPKSMEQIFAAAHAPYSYGLIWKEKYWQGKVEDWMAFEMIGKGGDIKFYLRVPTNNRNLMEAAIYAQYPEAEIIEAEDYVNELPSVLPNKTYEVYAADFTLREPTYIPIRTYPLFEDPVEERRVDPVAGIMEIMSKLKDDERLWIQVIVRPSSEDWKAEGRKAIDKIVGRENKKKKEGFFESIFQMTAGEVVRSPFEYPSLEAKKKDSGGDNFKLLLLTPGEKELIEAIERKISKLGMETTYRVLYIDKREAFTRSNMMAVFGALRQFHVQNLNSMRPDKKVTTYMKTGFLRERRLNWRRRAMYERYKAVVPNSHPPIFNTEELATVYHFPSAVVGAPQLQRIESKKGGAPPTLPTL